MKVVTCPITTVRYRTKEDLWDQVQFRLVLFSNIPGGPFTVKQLEKLFS